MSEQEPKTGSAVRIIGFAMFAGLTWVCFSYGLTPGVALFGLLALVCVVAK